MKKLIKKIRRAVRDCFLFRPVLANLAASVLIGIGTALVILILDGLFLKSAIFGITVVWVVFGAYIFQNTISKAFEIISFIASLILIALGLWILNSGYVCGMMILAGIIVSILSGSGILIKIACEEMVKHDPSLKRFRNHIQGTK